MLLFKKARIKHLLRLHKPAGVFLLFICINMAIAQNNQTTRLLFKPLFGNKALVLNDTVYLMANNYTIQFETFKFYISNLRFLMNDSVVWKENNSYHLYDAAVNTSHSLSLTYPSSTAFNAIAFNLGIDSVTNISGALEGDLDPTKGMYWTWQSGYINLKLEGKSSLSSHPKKEFQFHLGGYSAPFNALQNIQLPVSKKEMIVIETDLEKWIKAIDLSKHQAIMSPGANAVQLSKIMAGCFTNVAK